MRVVVPFDATAPKTRLAPVLDSTERRAFAECMLRDVVDAVDAVGGIPQVVATEPVDVELPAAAVRVDDRCSMNGGCRPGFRNRRGSSRSGNSVRTTYRGVSAKLCM